MTQPVFVRPDSSLIFRTGRPFGAAGEVSGEDVYGFPMPGTLAGALRAAWVDATGEDPLSDWADQRLLQLRGPLRCVVKNQQATVYVAAPGDAQVTAPGLARGRRAAQLLRAAPEWMPGCGSDLPYGLLPTCAPDDAGLGEPTEPASGHWTLHQAALWLSDQAPFSQAAGKHPHFQRDDLHLDRRVHAVNDAASLRSPDQGLHTSAGIEFLARAGAEDQGLLMLVDGRAPESCSILAGRRGRVGADGRTALYVPMASASINDLACPPALLQSIGRAQVGTVLRLWLVTPACYLRNGWYPDGLRPVPHESGPGEVLRGALVGLPGWTFELVAAVVPRFITHAGAAMRRPDGQPGFERRALRRLAPAGSIYWLKVIAKAADAVALHTRWLQPTCYAEYGRDGHGLALIGMA